jgi:hypothetical protein
LRTAAATGTDKSRLARPEPRWVRAKDHVKFVAKPPCPIRDRSPGDAHYSRYAQSRALGARSAMSSSPLPRTPSRGSSLWR